MDRLRRWEIPTTLPFCSNNRRMGVPGGLEQHQADGISSLDGNSRRMGDPNCSRTPRCCRGWRIRCKEASDDKSFHPTVLLLLHLIHSSTCAPGCDGSVLLTVNPGGGQTERDAVPNNPSLRGFDVIDAAKAAVEQSCPRTVSCADIVAFAARDSISLTGSVSYQVPAGRRDGRVSNASDTVDLPAPTSTAQTLIDKFKAKDLTLEDMVVLSGAHTVGRSFCVSFFQRVWNTSTNPPTAIVDAGLSPSYAALLRALCPSNTTQTTPITTAMDPGTPNVLDNNYYKLLPRGMGLFFSDNQLRVNTQMAALVSSFAANETLWKEKFAAAMVKMGRIQVQTGTCGEVRLNCGVVNPSSYSSSPASTVEMGSSAPAVDEEGYAAS